LKALVLAAGYATRLYPLTKKFPKPLLLVGGRPIIDYLIDKLQEIEQIDEVIVITNSKFIQRFKRWAKAKAGGKRISVVDDLTQDETDKRGAIGDMHFAITLKRIRDDLLVIGGDNLFDGPLHDFLRFASVHRDKPVIGVYDIKSKSEAKKYGVIALDKNNRIVDFQEKPEIPRSTLVAMCLYCFPKKRLGLIKRYIEGKANKKDATGFYIDWLRKKESVYGFIFDGRWYDIGHHKFYRQAQEKFV